MIPFPLVLLASPSPTPPAALDWGALEARRARIAEIRVEVQEVFDLANPKENTLLGRVADQVHKATRERVIREALLFRVGDPVNARHIHETERLLRSMVYLKEAEITPELLADGSVRARVRVRDAWTLKFSIHYNLLGGQTTKGFGLQEQNLLGIGKTLAFNWVQDPVRTTETFAYRDSQLLGSTWNLQTAYSSLSDGTARSVNLQHPFQSLDTPWSATFQASTMASTYGLNDHGATIYAAHSVVDKGQLGAAWAAVRSGSAVWRPGLVYMDREARYGPLGIDSDPMGLPPPDLATRVLRGPGLTLGYLEDGYGTWRNMAGVDAIEDYNLGWQWDLTAGSYLPALGASEAAPYLQADLSKGWSNSPDNLLLLSGSASGRRGPWGWEDLLANLTLTGYWKETANQITAAYLDLDRGCRADPEDIYYLGANEGLRGYPNFLHPGDTRWLLSLEQRALTEQRWLGIIRLGFVALADFGQIHRMDGTGWTSLYSDLGGGLRLGDLKSSLGRVILITASVPVTQRNGQKGLQLTINNVVHF